MNPRLALTQVQLAQLDKKLGLAYGVEACDQKLRATRREAIRLRFDDPPRSKRWGYLASRWKGRIWMVKL